MSFVTFGASDKEILAFSKNKNKIPSLKLTASSHLKTGWLEYFLVSFLGALNGLFSGAQTWAGCGRFRGR